MSAAEKSSFPNAMCRLRLGSMRYANNGVYLYDQGLWFVAL